MSRADKEQAERTRSRTAGGDSRPAQGWAARFTGVRVRLTVAVTLTFALALGLGAVLVVRSVQETVLRAVEGADKVALAAVAKQIESGVPFEKLVAPDDAPRRIFLRGFAADVGETPFGDGVRFRTGPRRGPPPGMSAGMPPPPHFFPGFELSRGFVDLFLRPPPPPEPGHVLFRKEIDGEGTPRDFMFVQRPLPSLDDPSWSVVESSVRLPSGAQLSLFAARPLEEIRRSAESLARVLSIGIPLLLVFIAAGAWVVVGRALSPVDAMTRKAQGIGASNLHERLPEPRSRDAIGELARMLNRMLARLEHAARTQRQFTSNASHELRSPVASIRTQLEVALAHPGQTDWQELARGILAEDRRLEALIADLLLLARLDEEAAPAAAELDLEDLVLDEVRRPRRVPIDASRVQPVRIVGHAAQLACVVRNLLDNANRHARSRVCVVLDQSVEAGARLIIDDDGPGIPLADRERVFERFTRLEEGRSRDAGGVGLGLALVRRIVDRHGGRVEIHDAPLGGARFAVSLPPDQSRRDPG